MKGIRLIKKDLQNGVTLIKDKNYNPYCQGVTRYSVMFFNYLVKKGMLSKEKVYRADLKYSQEHWYSLTLHTTDGFRFSFYGVTFGYVGEGSFGTAEILLSCGFNQVKRVFQKREHMASSDMIRLFKKDAISV